MADENQYIDIAKFNIEPEGHLLLAKFDGITIGSFSLKVAQLRPDLHQQWVGLVKSCVETCLEDVLGIKLDIDSGKSHWDEEKKRPSTDSCEQMEAACRPPSDPDPR